jgi:cellobiose-specific phosphotransferase system component IIA
VSIENFPAYPLSEVLDIKHRRVEIAEAVLKEKKRLLEVEQQKLKEREAERDKVKTHLKDKVDQLRTLLDEGTTSDKIDRGKVYIKVVQERLAVEEKKVKEQKQQVELAEKNVEIARNQLKDREKERDKLITHRKEWTKETRKEYEVLATRAEDELGSTMFLSKMTKAKDESRHRKRRPKKSGEGGV